MAGRSVLVSIAVLVLRMLGRPRHGGTAPHDAGEGQWDQDKPQASGKGGEACKAGKLALLVGINEYKAVNDLSGCVADVRNMQALLHGKFDFPDDSIRILTDEQATHAAIIQAFKDHLIGRAEDSAVVVFHYSGHGSRMKDPSGKSPSGEISTIVPHDSRTEGVYDISADELRGLFSLLAEKTKNVTFIFDSCHSGMVLKDVATARARVIAPDPRDPPPPPPEARLAPRGVGDASEGLKSRNYALLSACQADEVAFEYTDQKGNPCGTLTHFFVAEALGSGKAEATYRDVMDKVKAKVTGTYRRQHPQLEGANLDNYLLSDRSSLSDPFVPASPKGDGITFEAGQVHGMTVGSVFDVYPPGTKSFDDPSQATAQAELVTVGPYQSEAKRVGGQADPAVVAGCRAAAQLRGPQDSPAYRRRGRLGRPRQDPRGGRRRGPDRPGQPEVADLRPDLRGDRQAGRSAAPAQGDEDQAGGQVDRPVRWGRDGAFAPGLPERGGGR